MWCRRRDMYKGEWWGDGKHSAVSSHPQHLWASKMARTTAPPLLETRRGDIFAIRESDAVVCQQVNCVACKPHGLSVKFAEVYGNRGDVYGRRTPIKRNGNTATLSTRSKPGEIIYEPHEDDMPAIAHLVGQYMYGKCGRQSYRRTCTGEDKEHHILKQQDNPATRAKNFEVCLSKLAERVCSDMSVKTVYFPYKIGCGMAGGDWSKYKSMIGKFAINIKPARKTVVILKPQ